MILNEKESKFLLAVLSGVEPLTDEQSRIRNKLMEEIDTDFNNWLDADCGPTPIHNSYRGKFIRFRLDGEPLGASHLGVVVDHENCLGIMEISESDADYNSNVFRAERVKKWKEVYFEGPKS